MRNMEESLHRYANSGFKMEILADLKLAANVASAKRRMRKHAETKYYFREGRGVPSFISCKIFMVAA